MSEESVEVLEKVYKDTTKAKYELLKNPCLKDETGGIVRFLNKIRIKIRKNRKNGLKKKWGL